MNNRFPLCGVLSLALSVLAWAAALAEGEVGCVAGVLGSLQVRQPGKEVWEQVPVGSMLGERAALRTGPRSAARVVFGDGSVIEMAASTEVEVERIALTPVEKRYLSVLRLRDGKLRVLAGEAYGVEGSRFEVETPAAVVAAGGGEFVVLHDPRDELTTVVGIEEKVVVQGTIGLIGPAVTVSPHFLTRVRRGRFPGQPSRVAADELAAYQEGLAVLGTGDPDEGIGAGHPALNGRILRPEDLPEQVAREREVPPAPVRELPAGARWSGESLAESLSPDLRVHVQPIPEYKAARPGDRPTGGVQIEF